jgi:hypothetical protein
MLYLMTAINLDGIVWLQFVRRSSIYTDNVITSVWKITLDLVSLLMYVELFISPFFSISVDGECSCGLYSKERALQ